jgi:Na+-translocating ferredoxin:NAD+ oxidoreductase subunit E
MQIKYFTNGTGQISALGITAGVLPSLAVTTSAINGVFMGVAVTFVLLFSNIFISLFKKLISEQLKILSYFIIAGTFVAIAEILYQAYFQRFYYSLGIYIPLIAVNYIIFERGELFAKKNNVMASALNGLRIGLGLTLLLILIGSTREIFGSGSIFDYKFSGDNAKTITIFILPPAAFILFGYLYAFMKVLRDKFQI